MTTHLGLLNILLRVVSSVMHIALNGMMKVNDKWERMCVDCLGLF
jgi:hypothetical protein